ncbi:persephin [Crocuta crocuta]
MAPGKVLLCSLLLLLLEQGLSRGSRAWGAPVVEEEPQGTLRPQLGKDTLGPCMTPQLLPAQTPLAVSRPLSPAGARLRRALAGPCQLWSLPLPVAELGLGYASEETVIFRYCAGSCPRGARTQHGLTLARLRGQGRAHGGPCCRPTRYADVAFLDDRHRWQRVPQLSAAACSCGS